MLLTGSYTMDEPVRYIAFKEIILMKHFILEGKHLVPFEQFAHLEPRHHEFLQKGYDNGTFLFSGPKAPPHGGFLIARAESPVNLDTLLAEEPFVKGGFMQFSSVTEFHPAQHQPLLRDWFAGAPLLGKSPSKV